VSKHRGPESGVRTPVVIAIDGPAASGKSSTAQMIAKALGYRHVDSGALYRAAAAVALRTSTDADALDEPQVLAGVGKIELVPGAAGFVARVEGKDVEGEIRGPAVTRQVSAVARMPKVREWVDASVRKVAESYSVVVDGRDIGTAVFPNAPLKIYLIADTWERARRRLLQRLERHPSDDEIAEETDQLVHRDAKDAAQSAQAADAVIIDTTHLTQQEQVDRIVALARAVASH
jgi:cytidylate kinase